MEVKTCEQYVLSELEKFQEQKEIWKDRSRLFEEKYNNVSKILTKIFKYGELEFNDVKFYKVDRSVLFTDDEEEYKILESIFNENK